jgi:hypothetical protein
MTMTIFKILFIYCIHFETNVVCWLAGWRRCGKLIFLTIYMFIISVMFEAEFLNDIIINQHLVNEQSSTKRQIRMFCSHFSKKLRSTYLLVTMYQLNDLNQHSIHIFCSLQSRISRLIRYTKNQTPDGWL